MIASPSRRSHGFSQTSIYLPADKPEDWRRLLGDPAKHWRKGYSAWCLAHAWQHADGFPGAIQRALDATTAEGLRGIEMLMGFPEHQTALPGRGRPSQSDVFVFARSERGAVAIAVEGKVEEPFGPLVSEWLDAGDSPSRNKYARLKGLCGLLGLSVESVGALRYQLLHRTGAALIEAERYHARDAMMLVHSFSPTRMWFEDFVVFVRAMGGSVAEDGVITVGARGGIELHLAWVTDVCEG